jgi:hypothetical protein
MIQAKHMRASYNASNDRVQVTMPAAMTSAAPPTAPPMNDQVCSFTHHAHFIWNFIYDG